MPSLSKFRRISVAYARWRTAEELLARMAAGDPLMAGLLVKGPYGDARRDPLLRVAAAAAADMVRAEFGMGPAARARIGTGVGHEPPPGKFDGLLR